MRFALALLATLFHTSSVEAVVYGQADGDNHPNVGALVDDDWIYCSGALIARNMFLTAAHCLDDGATVTVAFSSVYEDGDKTYTGEAILHPEYDGKLNDMAVVVLSKHVNGPGIQPAHLPTEGSLSALQKKDSPQFTSVGYGVHKVNNQPGGKDILKDNVRREAVGTLNAVATSFLHISQNPALDNGGTCYGDSGGPNFLGSSDIIAALTCTGDMFCRATNDVQRLDTAEALDFLQNYVDLEEDI